MLLGYLPSPARGVWHLGPLPIRAYALCILAGIIVAVLMTQRRWVARGGRAEQVLDVAAWAVPFGIAGGRIYHVITSPELYFTGGRDPVRALYIWDGGLGIWGAVALGALGAWIGCRRAGIALPAFADAVAPGCSSRRPSAASATGSTRSSTAVRPRCPGPCASTPPTARRTPRTSPSTTRRSCTNCCGASPLPPCSCGPNGGST
ncbi:hypothetical protein GCM10027610_027100 [Dactylosporangium cerinum]